MIPDESTETSGYWKLGYVYDAGRFVTIRCKYADGQRLDVRLSDRVEECRYTIEPKQALSLYCK